ncbi:hypothetical protein B9Z55_024606 [Caenorhabditis nigoni]|nr:hypothetical protein B9Z55_024606 [Caenorhabditis nigoni]
MTNKEWKMCGSLLLRCIRITCVKMQNNKIASGFRPTGNYKNILPTRGITVSEAFPTALTSTSLPSKMNSFSNCSSLHKSRKI